MFAGLSNILTQKATAQPSTVTNDSQKSVSSHDSFDYGVDDEILGALDENILELEATFATASKRSPVKTSITPTQGTKQPLQTIPSVQTGENNDVSNSKPRSSVNAHVAAPPDVSLPQQMASESAPKGVRNVARSIPGPAGRLPSLSDEEKKRLFKSKHSAAFSIGQTARVSSILTQASLPTHAQTPSQKKRSLEEDPDFQSSLWLTVEKSLPNYKVSESGISFLFASACRLKIPRLVVLIKELGPVNPDSAAKFKDPSGEIRGVIHQNAFESDTVGPLLVPGSILELVDLSVIKPTKQTRHLNVTLQNINSVYLANGERHFCHHNKRPEENKESVLANLESFSDVF